MLISTVMSLLPKPFHKTHTQYLFLLLAVYKNKCINNTISNIYVCIYHVSSHLYPQFESNATGFTLCFSLSISVGSFSNTEKPGSYYPEYINLFAYYPVCNQYPYQAGQHLCPKLSVGFDSVDKSPLTHLCLIPSSHCSCTGRVSPAPIPSDILIAMIAMNIDKVRNHS